MSSSALVKASDHDRYGKAQLKLKWTRRDVGAEGTEHLISLADVTSSKGGNAHLSLNQYPMLS